MNNKLKLTYGTDPEIMALDLEHGKIVSSLNIIPNTKHNPLELKGGIKMYSDNVLIEASMPHADSVKGIVDRIGDAISQMQKKLGLSHMLMPLASHTYHDLPPKPDDELVMKWLRDEVPSDAVPQEWQVGCSPNYDAYAPIENNQRKQKPFADGLRSGSFHLHIGNANYEHPDEDRILTAESKIQAIKLLDVYVGCASVLFDKDGTSVARRNLYGKAGEFRPTPYGVEYRVLGNYALRHPKLVELVYDLADLAMSHINDGSAEVFMDGIDFATVQAAINEGNPRLARMVIDDSWLPAKLWDRVFKASNTTFASDSMLRNWGI